MFRSHLHSLVPLVTVCASACAPAGTHSARLGPQPSGVEQAAQSATARDVRRFKWAPANLLVYRDSVGAVTLWFATNRYAVADGKRTQLELVASFEPAEVEIWVELTRQLLALEAPPHPGDTSSIVASGALRAVNGELLAATRQRKGSSLDHEIRLLISPKELEKRLVFRLGASEVHPLLDAMGSIATHSTYTPPTPRDTTARRDEQPVRLGGGRLSLPRYPGHLQSRGIEGEVWVSYVVDEAGRVELPTIETLLSDHPDFVAAVRSWLAREQFEPHTVSGVPKRQRVEQRFVFGLGR